MKNITKADIVDRVAKATGITKKDTRAVLEGTLKSIVDVVVKGHKVEIRGFGVFHSRIRKSRLARNPKTGTMVLLEERNVPLFRPSSDFALKVNRKINSIIEESPSSIVENISENIPIVNDFSNEENSYNVEPSSTNEQNNILLGN